MKKPAPSNRDPMIPHPQPLDTGGEKLPYGGSDEADAFSRWLKHVEATSERRA